MTHVMDVEMRNTAQFAAMQLDITMPQGLGTGQLFTDNIDTVPIAISGDKLWYQP